MTKETKDIVDLLKQLRKADEEALKTEIDNEGKIIWRTKILCWKKIEEAITIKYGDR